MGKIVTFRDLNVWKESHKLALKIYIITNKFPKSEIYGLTSQMRSCAVSITSNIAEGFSRRHFKEKIQFYSISLGSLTELQSQILISKDIGFLNLDDFNNLDNKMITIHKLLNGLIKSSRRLN